MPNDKLLRLTPSYVDTNIGGNPYFVSDGEPINNFEFFRPLLEGLGYRFPTIRFPVGLMYYCAFFIEIIHRYSKRESPSLLCWLTSIILEFGGTIL